MKTNDFLLEDAKQHLEMMTALQAVKNYYEQLPLSEIWKGNEPHKALALADGSFHAALSRLQNRLFVHTEDRREIELAVDWNLKQPFTFFYAPPEASEFAPEESVVNLRVNSASSDVNAIGKKYWHDDFRHHATIIRLEEKIGQPQRSVLELGAGCGNLAAQLIGRWPYLKYTIIDLPDTLVFSMMFLRATYPEKTWQLVAVEDEILIGADFTFIPVGLEGALKGEEFDIFINTASLGEMPRKTVQHWFNFIQTQIKVRYLLSVNRFLNTVAPWQHWRLNENFSAFVLDSFWTVLDWELEPDFLRCPWANRHARQLYMLCERGSPIEDEFWSNSKAISGSWNNPPHHFSGQEVPLATDFTMTGILYDLWHGTRHNNIEASYAMLKYMDHLNGRPDRHFEEYHQIKRLLEDGR